MNGDTTGNYCVNARKPSHYILNRCKCLTEAQPMLCLWVAKPDLEAKRNHNFDQRFLNIANPWSDKQLANWKGHVEVRYFDAESRPVSADTPGARAIEMIPLALYGLDSPKIPMVLVDFRNSLNPKKREMSRRVLQDVTSNVLSLSSFGQPAYFLGRSLFDFVTGRRGIDINQPSRLRTYSQLKLLLALNESLDPEHEKTDWSAPGKGFLESLGK